MCGEGFGGLSSALSDFGARWGRGGGGRGQSGAALGEGRGGVDWMLSVGRRGDGRKGLGFGGGGMEEENELEEGEAYSGQEDDSCNDPDALSYIVSPLNNCWSFPMFEIKSICHLLNLSETSIRYGHFRALSIFVFRTHQFGGQLNPKYLC